MTANLQVAAETAREVSNNLGYLTAAYTAVWIVLAIYLLILWKRNQNLNRAIDRLEKRINELEGSKLTTGSGTKE